jgi:glucose/arabinose dehydrogenase
VLASNYCKLISFPFFVLTILISNIVIIGYYNAYAIGYSDYHVIAKSSIEPHISDDNLKAELVYKGTKFPSTMAFLGPNDILLLQKDDGTVERIVNGTALSKPLLHVNVSSEAERGMLGIAVAKHNNGPTYVFLYYTKAGVGGSESRGEAGSESLANVLYRYELVNNQLVNPKLLLSLPARPGPFHNGGKVVIGPDNNVYVSIGDLFGNRSKIQNFKNGTDPDGRGGILRITQDGQPVGKGIIGDKFPLNLYYGYGIRNSFGIDFDPITKKMWDTENGPTFGDEINLVEPGFNSGWTQVQGIWKPIGDFPPQNQGPIAIHPMYDLLNLGGKAMYRAPEFTWQETVGPTALKFLNSTKLGQQYKNDMFVGDFNNGILYHFKLNKQRDGLNKSISDNLVYSSKSIQESTNWNDPSQNCKHLFRCIINSTTGWRNSNDNSTLQISTNTTTNRAWSWIYGKDTSVFHGEQYELVTHMKLNDFVIGSHIALEGYNNKTNQWDEVNQITQCPSGTPGPLQWREFVCPITIPVNITKIRPVLNAGWSSQPGKEAVTLFDAIYVNQIMRLTSNNNLVSYPNFVQRIIFGQRFGHITDIQIGPDGYLYVLTFHTDRSIHPTEIFPYGSPVKEIIYRIFPKQK